MTHTEKTTRTPLDRWLFENGLTRREGAVLFRVNRTTFNQIVTGRQAASGLGRELIAAALLGELTLQELRRLGSTHLQVPPEAGTSPGNLSPGVARRARAAGAPSSS